MNRFVRITLATLAGVAATVDGAAAITLTNAHAMPGDPDAPFNPSGTSAADTAAIEVGAGLPVFALDLSDIRVVTRSAPAAAPRPLSAPAVKRPRWRPATRAVDAAQPA
jgi:hypothetical protein